MKNSKAMKILIVRNVYSLKSVDPWKGVLAELICTSILVIVGCGSCIGKDWASNVPSNVQISFTFGLAVATLVRCIGHVSGGHINPAVTIAMMVTRRMTVVRALLYILAQLAGALIGCGILKVVTPTEFQGDLGLTTLSGGMEAFPGGVVVEGLITFALIFTIFASCDVNRIDLNGSIPLSIGFCVVFCHMFAIKYTGSSLNPARTFGPAVVSGVWEDHWVYWVGPICGSILAALLYEFIFSTNASKHKLKHYITDINYTGDYLYDDVKLKDPCQCDDEDEFQRRSSRVGGGKDGDGMKLSGDCSTNVF